MVPDQAAQRAAAERKRCAEEEATSAARERTKRLRLEDDVKVPIPGAVAFTCYHTSPCSDMHGHLVQRLHP